MARCLKRPSTLFTNCPRRAPSSAWNVGTASPPSPRLAHDVLLGAICLEEFVKGTWTNDLTFVLVLTFDQDLLLLG